MINKKSVLIYTISFFCWVYRVAAIVTLIYFIIGFGALYLNKVNGKIELWNQYFPESFVLAFSALTFYIWYKIFINLSSIFKPNKSDRASVLLNLSYLFYISFFVDLGRTFYVKYFGFIPRTDWSRINWPEVNLSLSNYLFSLLQMFFKLTVVASGFLTPTTFGIASLILGLIAHVYSERNNEKSTY